MTTIPAYPLQWPEGWKRTPNAARTRARFAKKERRYNSWTDSSGQKHSNSYLSSSEVSIAGGVERVRAELARIGADDDMVISTNLHLRLDGLPKSGQREPQDPGAAVYWRDRNGAMRCMAIDRYDRVADNLAAIAATLEAMRAIERHGGAEILDRAFTGFTALSGPAPDRPWHVVLGVPTRADTDHVRRVYRTLRSMTHPDRGGDSLAFDQVQRAWAMFCTERGVAE